MARLKLRGDTSYSDFTINGKRGIKATGIKVGDTPRKAENAHKQLQAVAGMAVST